VDGFNHQNPIPAASRIGPFVVSGGISGIHPETGQTPPGIEEQCALMFFNMERLVKAAGGTTDNILKVTVWLKDMALRSHVNKEWLAMFPDPHSRPVRHTMLYRDLPDIRLVQCEFMAVLAT
jgi:2-iminobutanoate/2-iminopropanoate deaminase